MMPLSITCRHDREEDTCGGGNFATRRNMSVLSNWMSLMYFPTRCCWMKLLLDEAVEASNIHVWVGLFCNVVQLLSFKMQKFFSKTHSLKETVSLLYFFKRFFP